MNSLCGSVSDVCDVLVALSPSEMKKKKIKQKGKPHCVAYMNMYSYMIRMRCPTFYYWCLLYGIIGEVVRSASAFAPIPIQLGIKSELRQEAETSSDCEPTTVESEAIYSIPSDREQTKIKRDIISDLCIATNEFFKGKVMIQCFSHSGHLTLSLSGRQDFQI
jgi:hypothetical protein